MALKIEVKPYDTELYKSNIESFLPDKIIDIHTHMWLSRLRQKRNPEKMSWAGRIADENPAEDLILTYEKLFPGKKVLPLTFSSVGPDDDIEAANEYVRSCSVKYNFPSLAYAVPDWSAEEFERKIIAGGFLGCKVYLSFAKKYIPSDEIRIFDFLPHHLLEVLNRHGWICMLHIPRSKRLRDPVNIAQLMEIEELYPNVKLIVAHVGRAYCVEDVGNAFDILGKTQNMLFDISANTNSEVFKQLIETVGPERIFFGSDLPIFSMRARRISEDGVYINIVPKGLYKGVEGDVHMREVEGAEADRITFFLYEEIDAFRKAALSTGLTKKNVEDVFCGNAARLIKGINKEFEF